ncbi:MAG: hypothetical protein RLY78_4159 [Pseudomonadota bacterium]|jgi:tellurite resistance protein|uniref:TerB family tellurite resistance protein n=1 Tax=Pseudaquabacterium rugosum TaxID=2984194 RepID=A0ABU9BDC6_9BURK
MDPEVDFALSSAAEAAARLLAIVLSANGRIDERELAVLDRLQACERLSIGRDHLLDLVEQNLRHTQRVLRFASGLGLPDHARMLRLQQQVDDPALRLLVCRLAAAIITADGQVSDEDRDVYGFLLGQWGLTQSMVAQAIMRDRLH